MRRLKSKDKPTRPHPSQLPARLNSFGRVMSQEEQKREWSKRGLCEDCGLVKISQRTSLFGNKIVKLTVPGKVYKGICLQCNTLEYAKVKLGETSPRATAQRDTILTETRMKMSWETSTPSRAFTSSDIEDDVRTPPRGLSHDDVQISPRGMSQEGITTPSRGMSHDRVDFVGEDLEILQQHESDVPRSIGGCQRQLSDLSMIDFDTDPHLAHSAGALSTNLGHIVEDESSHAMGLLEGRIRAEVDDANYLENRPWATTANQGDRDQGAMDRLEARIRAKTNAQSTATKFSANNADQNSEAEGDAMERLEARIRIKSESNVATKETGDATHATNEANLMENPPLLPRGSDILHNSQSLGMNKVTARLKSGESSFDNSKPIATNMREESKVGYGLDEAQAADTRISDNLPGVVNMTGERLNVYEERIRRKNANSLIASSSASNSHTVTPRAASESAACRSQPGSTKIQGARLNLFERIQLKNHQQLQSDVNESINDSPNVSATQTYKQNDSNIKGLGTVESDAGSNTPGIYSIDRSNLFERRLQEKSDRNEATSNPGAFEKCNSGRHNVFDQRMELKKSAEDNRSKIPKTMTEYESDADVNNELREIINSEKSCDDVLGFIRLHLDSLPPSTIVFAYESIREIINAKILVAATSEAELDSGRHLFRSHVSWLKLFSSIVYKFFNNAEVSAGSLLTLWSIASYSPRHAEDIVSNDEIIESIVDCMEAHDDSQPVNEYGSGLICCLSLSKNSSLLLERCDGQIVRLLTNTISSTSGNVASHINSIRALRYLSTAFHQQQHGFFGDFMGRHLHHGHLEDCPSAKSIEAVLESMRRHLSQILIQSEGFIFLCQLLSRDAIVDIKLFNHVVSAILEHIVSVLEGLPRNSVLDEALMYLMSIISAYCSEATVKTQLWCWKHVVQDIMPTNNLEASTIIALHGCRFIYNLCCFGFLDTNVRSAIGEFGGIERVLICTTFEHRADIVEEACGAILALCYKEPSNKKKVLDSGGIEKIRGVLGIINGDFNSEGISLNILACAALITLAVDKPALQIIERLGIIHSLSLLLDDNCNDIAESLLSKMQDLVDISTSPGVSFDDDLNEGDTYIILLNNLKEVAHGELHSNTIDLMQAHTIKSMHTFPENNGIQQIGCKILASIFGGSSSNIPNINCLEAVVSLISSEDVMTIATAASACKNFCVAQSLSALDAYESQRLQNSLVRSVEQLISGLRVCKDDNILREQVSSALWAIATVEEASILSFESLVSIMLELIEEYQCVGCLGLLYVFFLSSVKTMDFLTDNMILAYIKCMQSEDEKVAVLSLHTMLAIACNGAFPAIEMMLTRHELLIGAVVECMFKFKSPQVIRAACSFFRNLSLDNYYRFTICNLGGIGRVIDALREFTNDETTSCKAIMALTNLISGCDIEILCSNNVANNILETMTVFKEDLLIQVNGADAIWHLASRDDSFKDILVEIGSVQHLSVAMHRFIISEQMTKVGILSLWSLSVPQHLKTKVAQNGLLAVVNGMSTHCSSEKVCEDGLGALKSMSNVNGENIDFDDILDLIYSCMWLHSHHASIQQASLAALVNLSVNTGTNQVSRITNEELNTIVEMMRIHQDKKGVQENAIILLRNLTFSPHNCSVLQRNHHLASLIHTAMANFHDNFKGRAEDLLRVLPQ